MCFQFEVARSWRESARKSWLSWRPDWRLDQKDGFWRQWRGDVEGLWSFDHLQSIFCAVLIHLTDCFPVFVFWFCLLHRMKALEAAELGSAVSISWPQWRPSIGEVLTSWPAQRITKPQIQKKGGPEYAYFILFLTWKACGTKNCCSFNSGLLLLWDLECGWFWKIGLHTQFAQCCVAQGIPNFLYRDELPNFSFSGGLSESETSFNLRGFHEFIPLDRSPNLCRTASVLHGLGQCWTMLNYFEHQSIAF